MTLNCPTNYTFITMQLLKFSTGNAKLSDRLIFSLPAGYTCPHAGVCKAMADRTTGKLLDNVHTLPADGVDDYRCFAAMSEARSKNAREARWHNWDLLRTCFQTSDKPLNAMAGLIKLSLLAQDNSNKLVRIHESGDFFNELYMAAWFQVAKHYPDFTFYGYTKSLGMWYHLKDSVPSNMYLTASVGGTLDYLIPKYSDVFQRVAYVVYSEEEAAAKGLEVDHDDSHCLGDKPFALIVHSTQRAGSAAQKAIMRNRKEGKFSGYNKKQKQK